MTTPSRRPLADALFLLGVFLLLPLGALPLTAATNQPAVSAVATPSTALITSAPSTTSPKAMPVVTTTPTTAGPTTVTSPAASPSPAAAVTETNSPTFAPRDLPEIHAKISLPKEWSLLPGKLLEGDVLLATREKIATENDPWSTGLSMTIDRNGPKDSGQKASAYAKALAQEAREKAGDEASPLKESQSGPFHDIRFDFPLASEPPLLVTEVLRANDATGTLAVIIWQMPKEESVKLQPLRDAILSGLILNPAQ